MKSKYHILPYQEQDKKDWDALVAKSPNSTLLHFRDFMEYHKDRFEDASLLFFKNNKLVAVLPVCKRAHQYISHAGLTYGGFVVDFSVESVDIICFFECLIDHLKDCNITEFVYKQMPYIYHKNCASIDQYALFKFGFELQSCNLSSFCYLPSHASYTLEKKRSIKKAKKILLDVVATEEWEIFWTILENNLILRYDTKPTHTLSEIRYLKEKFPQHIQLVGVFYKGELLSGAVLFISSNVVHLQYIASSPQGREICANDLLVSTILETYPDKQAFFDYGISTENGGSVLNLGLLHHKEGFGLSPITYNTYRLVL